MKMLVMHDKLKLKYSAFEVPTDPQMKRFNKKPNRGNKRLGES